MSLQYSCRPPHSKPPYPQQVTSFAEYHSSANGAATPLVSPPFPLFKPTLPMGTIHRHLKRKLSSISSEAGQKEDPCTRPMLDIKKPRRWGPDGRVVQAGTHQHIAVLLPTKLEPVHVGGTRITAVTSSWRVHPASRDDESSESDTSDDDEETAATHTTRNARTEQPSTVYKDANQFLNSLHKARASRPSSVLLSLQTPNTGTAPTFPRRISTNHSPISPLHLKKPTGPLRHPPHQENPDEQAERDLVTKQYEEANQLLRMLKLKRRPPSAPAMGSSSEEKNEGNE